MIASDITRCLEAAKADEVKQFAKYVGLGLTGSKADLVLVLSRTEGVQDNWVKFKDDKDP